MERLTTGRETDQAIAADRSPRLQSFVTLAMLGTALLWAYWSTLTEVALKWGRDPKYSHGYLVPVFALIVLWWRQEQWARVQYRPNWWGVPLVAAGVALRLFGAYCYFPWFDEVSLLPSLAGLAVLWGGKPAWRWSWPATAFLVFMVPLPYQLEVALAQPLQQFATLASTYALQTLGIPALAEGNIIFMDDLQIGVLEACNGLGMLMTFFALSTAVALVIRRSWLDRIIIFLSAIPIAVIMNVARITVTGVLHRTVGSDLANRFFHDLAGWLMMPPAMGLLWLELLFLAHLFIRPEPTGSVPVPLPGPGRSFNYLTAEPSSRSGDDRAETRVAATG